ncbi:MAG: hypothetical protein LIQ31_00075, partial [Planctomycetes bacterium]|nr:hypothetical protein [Planctomycetota bacterium]
DLGPIRVISDENVDRGGIIAATRESEVDMQLATRLAAFEEVILGFSGEEATAPWSVIPPDAIAQAKAASQESAFSLYDDNEEADGDHIADEAAQEYTEPDASDATAEADAPTPEPENPPDPDAPPPDGGAESGDPSDPAGQAGQADDAFMAQSDLADLAELAEMADGDAGGGGGGGE